MYNYKVTIAICWKNLSFTYEVIDIETTNPFEDSYEFYKESIIINYEASLPYELLENVGYIDVIDVTFLGDK